MTWPDFNQFTVGFGFVSAIALAIVTIRKSRKLDLHNVGSFAAAFLSGSNLPAAIILCLYGFAPDPANVATKLHGCEKYVAFAGLTFLFVNIVSLWTLFTRHLNESSSDS